MIDAYTPLIFFDTETQKVRDKVMGMRIYPFKEIENWLLGVHFVADNEQDARLSGEAIDAIKDMRKALNCSIDMRRVYDAACAEERERIIKEISK